MRIGEVIGKLTLSRWHPSLQGGRYVIVEPMLASGLKGDAAGREEAIIVYDELGAGPGTMIAISEGTEAAAPFDPVMKPIDAYNSAILDLIELEEDSTSKT
jgi:ethanolamine utilization protein EutN